MRAFAIYTVHIGLEEEAFLGSNDEELEGIFNKIEERMEAVKEVLKTTMTHIDKRLKVEVS